MIKNKLIAIGIFFFLLIPINIVNAQAPQDNPVYVVESGDTISSISIRFGVPAADLISANKITDPNSITAGMELIIPGLTGVSGKLSTQTVSLGETLNSLSLQYQVPKDVLIRLNRITSPLEIFAGTNLILPQQDQKYKIQPDAIINSGESLFEVAIRQNKNPWSYLQYNDLSNNWNVLPGGILFYKSTNENEGINSISPYIKNISISPLPLVQGKTTVIKILTNLPIDLKGSLSNYPLHFFKNAENEYIALQGISSIQDIGLTELILKGRENSKEIFNLDQGILVASGDYGQDPPLEVDPSTIDPAVTKPEDDLINSYTSKISPIRLWKEAFQYPTDEPCIKSYFGNRRMYNGILPAFHTGLDLGVCANNLNIYAAAPGVVVFTGLLTIRGNTTIIDNGWGIFTLYFHQKEFLVKVGDKVNTRQNIGIIGDTGRVTGPHLHWEIRVNNIQINPVDWTKQVYP